MITSFDQIINNFYDSQCTGRFSDHLIIMKNSHCWESSVCSVFTSRNHKSCWKHSTQTKVVLNWCMIPVRILLIFLIDCFCFWLIGIYNWLGTCFLRRNPLSKFVIHSFFSLQEYIVFKLNWADNYDWQCGPALMSSFSGWSSPFSKASNCAADFLPSSPRLESRESRLGELT